MSGVVFVVYIPTPEEEEKIRRYEQASQNEEGLVGAGEGSPSEAERKSMVSLGIKKLFGILGYDKKCEGQDSNKSYNPLRRGSSYDSPDLKETKGRPETSKKTLKETLGFLLKVYEIRAATWFENESDLIQVVFSVPWGKCEDLLDELLDSGVGNRYRSNLSIVPCTLYYEASDDVYPPCKSYANKIPIDDQNTDGAKDRMSEFMRSVKARFTVAQVVKGVETNSSLTFDFFALLILGSMLAAMGLVDNNAVYIVASMCVCPLMGPILAFVFGSSINDRNLIKKGIVTGVVGMTVCSLFGFWFGVIGGPVNTRWGKGPWPTEQMVSMGHWRSLWIGALTAIPSGGGVALAVLGGNMACLVGVAIAASLLPPAVNAGMMWGYSLVLFFKAFIDPDCIAPLPGYETIYYDDMILESAMMGLISFALLWVNVICIAVVGVFVLRVKEVVPGRKGTERFWKHDIRVTRSYNKGTGGTEKSLHKQLMNEWSALNSDITDEKILERRLSYKIRQCHEDPTLQNVTNFLCYRTPAENLIVNRYKTWTCGHPPICRNDDPLRRFSSQFNRRRTPKKLHDPSLFNIQCFPSKPDEEMTVFGKLPIITEDASEVTVGKTHSP